MRTPDKPVIPSWLYERVSEEGIAFAQQLLQASREGEVHSLLEQREVVSTQLPNLLVSLATGEDVSTLSGRDYTRVVAACKAVAAKLDGADKQASEIHLLMLQFDNEIAQLERGVPGAFERATSLLRQAHDEVENVRPSACLSVR